MSGVSITLDDLLRLALTGQPYNQQRLGNEAYRYARRISGTRCSDLPDDLHVDIFHQAFAEFLGAGSAGIQTQSPKQAFRRAIYTAIRAVRASYAPPGRRTRYRSSEVCDAKVAAEDVGRVIGSRELEQCILRDRGSVVLDFDRVASPAAANVIKQIEDRLTVEVVMARAPSEVALALRSIHIDDESVESVATRMGISRFSLNRRITAFLGTWRLVA